MFYLCSILRMERLDKARIAEAILAAPGWARVGITAPAAWTREDAAREMAQAILEQFEERPADTGDSQIGLGL
jgi:hypothetical protein